MMKLYFTESQPKKIKIVALPNEMYDVTVLTNETYIDPISDGDTQSDGHYEYDGNIFRTIYPVTESEIAADLEIYLNYDSSTEPTLDEYKQRQSIIDEYTLQLIEEGIII